MKILWKAAVLSAVASLALMPPTVSAQDETPIDPVAFLKHFEHMQTCKTYVASLVESTLGPLTPETTLADLTNAMKSGSGSHLFAVLLA